MLGIKRAIIAITAALTASTITVGLTVGPAHAGTVSFADMTHA